MADQPIVKRPTDPESPENRAALARELDRIADESRSGPWYTVDEVFSMTREECLTESASLPAAESISHS